MAKKNIGKIREERTKDILRFQTLFQNADISYSQFLHRMGWDGLGDSVYPKRRYEEFIQLRREMLAFKDDVLCALLYDEDAEDTEAEIPEEVIYVH